MIKLIMNRILYLTIILVLPLTGTVNALEDKVVAIVNDRVVLQSQLNEKLSQVDLKNVNRLEAAKLRNRILDELIEQSLLEQAGSRLGIRISDIDLQNQIKLIAKRQNLTVLQLKDAVEAQNISYSKYINTIRSQIQIQELFRTQFTSRAYVSQEEIDSYLKNNVTTNIESRMNIKEYFIQDDAAKLDIGKVKILVKSIKKGGVEEYKTKYPNFDIKISILDNVVINDLPDIYQNNLEILDENNFSNLFKTGRGFVFLEVIKSNVLVNEYKVSHILMQTNPMEDSKSIKNKFYDIKAKAMTDNNFDKYAQEYSLDKASAIKGGSLGWITKELVVDNFRKVMVNTPVGTISEPFKSKFGWHILYLEDKRVKNITGNLIRNKAVSILKERKVAVAKREWLSKLKDQAYIEIVNE